MYHSVSGADAPVMCSVTTSPVLCITCPLCYPVYWDTLQNNLVYIQIYTPKKALYTVKLGKNPVHTPKGTTQTHYTNSLNKLSLVSPLGYLCKLEYVCTSTFLQTQACFGKYAVGEGIEANQDSTNSWYHRSLLGYEMTKCSKWL